MQSVCNRAETVVIQRDDFRKDAMDASAGVPRDCVVYLDGLYDAQQSNRGNERMMCEAWIGRSIGDTRVKVREGEADAPG